MKERFHLVKSLSPWKKFSVALWPSNGTRFCEIKFNLTGAVYFKEVKAIPWTPILIYLLSQTIKSRPNFNQFIRRYRHYTRENIDIFYRITLDKDTASSEGDSLWGHYLRGTQDQTPEAIYHQMLSGREKYSDKSHRYEKLQAIVSSLHPSVLVVFVKSLSFWMRMGMPFPIVSKIAFPSISVSNNGSLDSPPAFPLLNPLTFAPVNINFGTITVENGITQVTALAGFDHRIFDGQDLQLFIKEFHRQVEKLSRNSIVST